MIWREKRLLLVILGALLAANVLFFFTYRVQYEARLKELDTRLQESEARLQQAKDRRATAERQYAAYRKVERDVQQVYNERWSTQSARLGALISEVKRLAVASQLVPQTYSFTQAAGRADQSGSLGATTVGISFQVAGTYQQARRLINLLELSPQFVIVDSISLSSQGGDVLGLSLHVKTLFRDPNAAPVQKTL